MEDLPAEIKGLGVGGIVAGLLVLWRKISRERVESSKDALATKGNDSQIAWLEGQEARIAEERKRAEAAEARERVKHAELMDTIGRMKEQELALHLARARVARLESKCNRLTATLAQLRPEMAEYMVTEPAPLDEPKAPP
jgi:hypothetical protein